LHAPSQATQSAQSSSKELAHAQHSEEDLTRTITSLQTELRAEVTLILEVDLICVVRRIVRLHTECFCAWLSVRFYYMQCLPACTQRAGQSGVVERARQMIRDSEAQHTEEMVGSVKTLMERAYSEINDSLRTLLLTDDFKYA